MLLLLDTSVVVAAARSRRGASSLLINWLGEGRFNIAISAQLILEYEKLLRRQVHDTGWSDADVDRFLDFMCNRGQVFEPSFKLRPTLIDPNDEFILELAFVASIDYLVTHNVRDFARCGVFGVKVLSPGEAVRMLRGVT